MIKIGIIMGSTRPNRVGEGVARWILNKCRQRHDAEFELVDLKDFNLPLLDEPVPAGMSQDYQHPHTKNWSAKVKSLDAFIFITPEYNHSTSGALKNAIDYLYQEWNNKAAAFVGYGGTGGLRGIEHLKLIMAELQVATIRNQLEFSLRSDFENYKEFRPAEYHLKTLNSLLDQLLLWGEAFRNIRHNMEHPREIIDKRDDGRSATLH
jgi:NAD(P)H-dependent FMN reductase